MSRRASAGTERRLQALERQVIGMRRRLLGKAPRALDEQLWAIDDCVRRIRSSLVRSGSITGVVGEVLPELSAGE